jgi:rubrerythrin
MALKSKHEETKAVFHTLAEDEKIHLQRLGNLLRAKLLAG